MAPHITICVCTYQRPELLLRLLEKLKEQKAGGAFTFSVVVADNDLEESARAVVEKFSATSSFDVDYCVEPQRNIARVRNAAVARAKGEFIACIDDDEFPVEEWLSRLLECCNRHGAAGVLGPVRPHFDQPPPKWIVRGKFCDRPEHPTGTKLGWKESRTGNVLFRRSIVDGMDEPFAVEFGTGGEDQDFFRRMISAGHVFVWCNEAIAYETVPPARWTRSFMIKRALLRGRNSLKHPKGRIGMVAKSLLAVPIYLVSLPMTLVVGQHKFMKCLVKLCDHFGRVLTILRLNPVREREM